MEIKPIETPYKGYRFRSRLEARWAVFFDSLRIKWEYEKQGFVLPPYEFDRSDFINRHIADARKGGVVKELETIAEKLVAQASKELTYLPDFWLPEFQTWAEVKPEDMNGHDFLMASEKIMRFVNFGKTPCLWCSEFSKELKGMRPTNKPHIVEFASLVFGGDDEVFIKAVTAARSARFEHGESPIIK